MESIPDNPYAVASIDRQYASAASQHIGVGARAMLLLVWTYPLLPLAMLYFTWIVAWIVLGHAPRPSLDDPKSISSVVDVSYLVTLLLLMSMPFGLVIGLVIGLVLTRASPAPQRLD